MRSSKSRSRSKANRNRPSGNIINRVFDSSGPEGKVRGTPQQVIDKYIQLARDAQLSGDRVALENFQQHAEHYIRMLNEAQREMNERRDQNDRDRQQPSGDDRQDDRYDDRDDRQQDRQQERQQDRPAQESRRDNRREDVQEDRQDAPQPGLAAPAPKPSAPKVSDFDAVDAQSQGSDLVETPETAPKPRRGRRPKNRDAAAEKTEAAAPAPGTEAAE